MKKHTQGPWTVEANNARWISYIIRGGVEGNQIAQTFNWQDRGFDICSEANARLIAAAPDLLEALESMIESFCVTQNADDYQADAPCNKARSAIRKARGVKHAK